MDRIRVAVVMGGASLEHDVSMDSGDGVLSNLDGARYTGLPVVISREGLWSFAEGPEVDLPSALRELKARADVVFLALHGPNGEDGTMQAVLTLTGIPYTGSDHYASSLAMNKPRTKDVYCAAGLTVARQVLVPATAGPEQRRRLAEQARLELGLPAVVKATRLGSSFGVDIVRDEASLHNRVDEFMGHSGCVMIEQFIQGRELTASVIDDPDSQQPVALPLIEIRPKVSQWFDYRAKYEVGASDEICPAPVDEQTRCACQQIGLTAHRILGCSGMSRTDMILDGTGTPYVIETNTIPGFTRTSLLPQAAQAAGISYAQLVDLLVRGALRRPGGLEA